MQLISILVAFVLGALALAFVLYPLYHQITTKTSRIASLTASANSHTDREQSARAALQEIELDYRLGNLAEPDYRSLRERYVRRAFLAMKSRHEREQELDDVIEEQLRQLREQHNDNT